MVNSIRVFHKSALNRNEDVDLIHHLENFIFKAC